MELYYMAFKYNLERELSLNRVLTFKEIFDYVDSGEFRKIGDRYNTNNQRSYLVPIGRPDQSEIILTTELVENPSTYESFNSNIINRSGSHISLFKTSYDGSNSFHYTVNFGRNRNCSIFGTYKSNEIVYPEQNKDFNEYKKLSGDNWKEYNGMKVNNEEEKLYTSRRNICTGSFGETVVGQDNINNPMTVAKIIDRLEYEFTIFMKEAENYTIKMEQEKEKENIRLEKEREEYAAFKAAKAKRLAEGEREPLTEIQVGGDYYYRKYLKYKQKYLALKKQIH